MNPIVQEELDALFKLLKYGVIDHKKAVEEIVRKIEREIIFELEEGLEKQHCKECDGELSKLKQHVDSETFNKTTETAASRIMVAYYAEAKKEYNEEQKEIFLTFLLTNKLQRALEKDCVGNCE